MSSEKDKNRDLDLKSVGARLKEVRDTLGLTLEKIHEATGFSRSLISEAENGIKKPSSIYLFALLDRFNVNANYILAGRGAMFISDSPLTPAKSYGRPDDKSPAVKFVEEYAEMMTYIENVDMVKYAMLSYFISFKTQNYSVIKKLLDSKKSNQTG